ncbi:MAG TPA: MlaD family protein [Nocardioidaceae bacterium]|nr:MlaD family protein [Nocardioidaceae bacterium]
MAPRPVHRDEARKFAWGLVTLTMAAVVFLIGGIVQTGGPVPAKKYTYVKASFNDVGILKSGKAVKENGLRVGQVSDIAYRDGLAEVTLRLDGDRTVYRDGSATVSNVSALGKKYVELDPGTASAGELGDGVLPAEQNGDSQSLEDALSALDPATRTALRSTLEQVGGGVAGHGPDLHQVLRVAPDLLPDVRTLTGALTSSELEGLLASADTLAGRFVGRTAELEQLMRNADATVSALAVDGGQPLAAAVRQLPSTLREAKSALDALNRPLVDAHAALADLRPGGQALGRSSDDLRGFLRDAVGPLGKVPGVSDQALPAVDELTATLEDLRPLLPMVSTSLASVARLLFDFAPYAGDAARFVSQHDLLSGTLGGDDKHYFAAMLTGLGLFSMAGAPDPLATNEFYPAPGTAWNHTTITEVDQ